MHKKNPSAVILKGSKEVIGVTFNSINIMKPKMRKEEKTSLKKEKTSLKKENIRNQRKETS